MTGSSNRFSSVRVSNVARLLGEGRSSEKTMVKKYSLRHLFQNVAASEAAVTLSKQMAVTIMDHMMQFGYAEVTRFPTTSDYAGIARNAYGIGGSGSLLVEIKGQEETGQKQKGMLVRHIVEMMMSVLEATADGSLISADPARVSELPERGTRYSKDLPVNDHSE